MIDLDERLISIIKGIGYSAITYAIIELLFSQSINISSYLFDLLNHPFDPNSPLAAGLKASVGLLGFVTHETLRYLRNRNDKRFRLIGFIIGMLLYLIILSISNV